MATKHPPKELDSRIRDQSGEIRQKRGESLPSRNPKTGSYTTDKSTSSISDNARKYSSALKELAKK